MVVSLFGEPPTEAAWAAMSREEKGVQVKSWDDAIVMQIGEGPYPKVAPTPPGADRGEAIERTRQRWGERKATRVAVTVSRPGDGVVTLAPLFNAIQSAGWAVSDHPKWLKVERVEYVFGAALITVTLEA